VRHEQRRGVGDPGLRGELHRVGVERHDREAVLRPGVAVELDGLVHLEVQPAFDRGHQAELLRCHDHPLTLLPVPRHVLLDRVRVVELAVALQRIPHVIETGPVLLEERPEHAGARMKDPGPDELAGLDLIGVREDVGRRALRIARGGDAPRQIRETLPYRPPVNAPRGPRGTSRRTRMVTSTRSASYAGSLASESTRALATESGFSFVACLSESARIESARALSFASESPRAGAYRKKLRPMDQCTVRP